MLFRTLKSGGIFVIEELDFPDVRRDMNILNEKPTLREILKCIEKKENFFSRYINEVDKEYFLNNFQDIKIFKGNSNEIAFVKKK